MNGPLAGTRIVELPAIGPVPFAAMLLAELGAEVIRIRRPAEQDDGPKTLLHRSRAVLELDLKRAAGLTVALRLVERADALLEGFRPGVAERLGLGPEECRGRNPRLVYGQMTGWGQSGPLAAAAGHDVNYIALAGALAHIGPAGEPPVIPLNLVGDFGGGALYLALGVVSCLLEARTSGRGQIVDAAMVDGAASLMTAFHGHEAAGLLGPRGTNRLDGGAPYYSVYECADGRYVAVGAIEPKFYAELVRLLELEAELPLELQDDSSTWEAARATLAARFRTRPREEWCELLEGTDACFAPVLSLDAAPAHPHNVARGTFIAADGAVQPGPAPRLSRTPGAVRPAPPPGDALRAWGFDAGEVERLLELAQT